MFAVDENAQEIKTEIENLWQNLVEKDHIRAEDIARCAGFTVSEKAGELGLVWHEQPTWTPLTLHVRSGKAQWRQQGGRSDDLLLRAIKGSNKNQKIVNVLDATAGLGGDSTALAAAGFNVIACERTPLLSLLWLWLDAKQVLPRSLSFICADAIRLLDETWLTTKQIDAVYLDPMYDAGPRDALPKKEMQLLRALVGDDDNAAQLLAKAKTLPIKRIVVKRPKKAPPIDDGFIHQYIGSTTRYDLYRG